MKWKIVAMGIFVFMVAVQCSTTKDIPLEAHDRIRQATPDRVKSYHAPAKLEIAWMPYQEYSIVHDKKNEWRVVKGDDLQESAMPMILLTYPNSSDTLWLDMTTDNELLGRLLKHTLMTQVPITRPFTEYVEIAKCSTCHPAEISIDFMTEKK